MSWPKRAFAAIGVWLLIAVAGFLVSDFYGGGTPVGGLFSALGFVIGVIYLLIPLFRGKSSPL